MNIHRFIAPVATALMLAVLPGNLPAQDKKADPKKEEKFDVAVELTGNDLMKYDKAQFTVKPGQRVKLTFKNIGKLPKVAMGHNVVVLKKGSDPIKFATESAKAGPAKGYIPDALKKLIIAKTKLLGPGESDTIYFTAPEAGIYDYLCTFPAHFVNMKGKMIVKK